MATSPRSPTGAVLWRGDHDLGIGMLALPTGVFANGFANEIHKRDFIVNWKLDSSVPLFKDLDVAQIA